MKYFIFLLFISTTFLSFSQRYFSSIYYSESYYGAGDGSIKVEFHNHDNPVHYEITEGASAINNTGGALEFLSINSVVSSDSMANVGLSGSVMGLYVAYAIDAVTNDTIGVLKSLHGGDFGSVIDFDIVNSLTSSSCDGVVRFSGSNLNTLQLTDTVSYMVSTDYYSSLSTLAVLVDSFALNNLCPGYYQMKASYFDVTFYIDPIINTISDSVFNSSISVSTTADSSNCEGTAIVSVNSTSAPYLYSVDGGAMTTSNSFV